ncbi:HNH endonuclease [Pseudarthrobacter sp. DSP2-3-2b1]|uniref:HNH endonuclease n=1 Tax=Pseudarthrobacter sp. DSP2-3-2b1 TaxID=2804661 RepID=UPI003CF88EB1
MAAVFLGWNPDRWTGWNYRAVVEEVADSGQHVERWSVGRRRNIKPGTEAWLVLQGGSDAGRGLIGHGTVVSETFEAEPSGAPAAPETYVSVAFDALLPLGEQIQPGTLVAAVPGIRWQGSNRRTATPVPPSSEPGLRQLWREQGPAAVDPACVVPGTYPREAVSRIEVNRYELDPGARRMCLAFHGTSCAACGFSFEATYGVMGEGFIHVHHTVPASLLGISYQLDPVADLVPLCANCHAMAHRGVSTPRTVPELRSVIAASGHVRGETVSEQALEAQENARRILETHHE